MTLTEKLNLIADLETERLDESLIESLVEQIEHPEPVIKRYSSVTELMADLDDNED